MKRKILCCGLTTIDLIEKVDALPAHGTKVQADTAFIDVGGPATNAARTVSALGHEAHLLSLIGVGPLAQLARGILAGADVAVTDLAHSGAPAVSTILLTPDGERTVVSANNAGREAAYPDASVLDRVDAVVVDGHLLPVQVPLARQARQSGIPVILDAGSYKPGLDALLGLSTHIIASADFRLPDNPATDIELVTELYSMGPTLAARSAGPKEVIAAIDGNIHTIPITPAPRIADTLGAGDVLHGAFAAALADERSELEALVAATQLATLSTRFPGALGWSRD
ncbi:MAG: PfkB family carbohydrate kinase [Flaviflexus sp.]|nr:PfkB family carbohydrate kinase [Flaviflexus sp.]